jgi:hypothetical protein
MPTNPGSNQPLSEQQLERSTQSRKRKLFADVKPSQLFSAQLDPVLSAEVYRKDPVLYRALKLEYQYQTHQLRRPDDESSDREQSGIPLNSF